MSSERLTRLWTLLLAALALCSRPLAPHALADARSGAGNVFLTVEEALELAFPGCKVERSTVYLDKDRQKRVSELAKRPFDTGVVFPYVATREGVLVGTAYFDTHRVRSLRETLMLVVSPKGEIARIELLAFAEPKEYIPRPSWYEQFAERELDDALELGRAIRSVRGATLTARATTDCARRTLALHRALEEKRAAEERRPRSEPAERP